jgi:hypothetical protein
MTPREERKARRAAALTLRRNGVFARVHNCTQAVRTKAFADRFREAAAKVSPKSLDDCRHLTHITLDAMGVDRRGVQFNFSYDASGKLDVWCRPAIPDTTPAAPTSAKLSGLAPSGTLDV